MEFEFMTIRKLLEICHIDFLEASLDSSFELTYNIDEKSGLGFIPESKSR